jgi:3-phosphoshikimate 1-carboxyvinyltransferase
MNQPSSINRGPARARKAGPLNGRFAAPGDKSVSHRALILGALAHGVTRVEGLLESEDVLNTGKAVAALGAQVENTGPGQWKIVGTSGKFVEPQAALDFGNSGTGVRLMMGAVAGTGISASFIGDESLSSRPMARVTDPLSRMGANFGSTEGRLPAELTGGVLTGLDYEPPIASAQVKSAILLAGLGATGETIIREAHATRDHTERMLAAFGATIDVERSGAGLHARLSGPQTLTACDISVPGDPSSAAFAIIAALIIPGSSIQVSGVMDNPSRTGLLRTLEEMGADITYTTGPEMAGESTIDISVRASMLHGIDVPADRAPSMIDEYPVLAVAASFAQGITRLHGLAELRAKESDRLASTAAMLKANGVQVDIGKDSLTVHGCGPGLAPGGGHTHTHHDHRLAMSGLVMGLAAQSPSTIDDAAMIATSYPSFFDHMHLLGARLEEA